MYCHSESKCQNDRHFFADRGILCMTSTTRWLRVVKGSLFSQLYPLTAEFRMQQAMEAGWASRHGRSAGAAGERRQAERPISRGPESGSPEGA